MKTLKRTLCLVLALVMVVGMLAVGASAKELTDAADVQYEVPVNVMVGMGIIDGYDDDSFQPKKVVNRAEAAKMICYALIGKQAADGLVCAAKPFEDVEVNAWYAPYVSYLAKLNVIAGYDGKFDAAAPVTGLALAKMLLVAAGYGQEDEYEDAGYVENTYIDAMGKGIFTDTKATDLTAGATREEAALYIYNAMTKIDQVKYAPGSSILGIGSSYPSAGKGTMAESGYSYNPADAGHKSAIQTITSVAKDTNKLSKTYGKLIAATGDGYSFVVESYDKVGHKAYIYAATDAAGDAVKNKVYYVDYTTYTVSTAGYTTAAKWTTLGKTVTLAMTDATTPSTTAPVYTNYAASTGTTAVAANQTLIVEKNTNSTQKDTIVGIQVNDVKDVKIDVTYTQSTKSVKAAFNDTSLYDIANDVLYNSIDTALPYGQPDVDLDASNIDWASYVSAAAPSKSVYYRVQLVDGEFLVTDIPYVTGEVTMVNASTSQITIGGQTLYYNIPMTHCMGTTVTIDTAMIGSGNTYKAFLGTDGKIAHVDLVAGTDVSAIGALAYAASYDVVDTTPTNGGAFSTGDKTYAFYVQLAFADGKYGTYKIAKYNGDVVVDTTAMTKLTAAGTTNGYVDFQTSTYCDGDEEHDDLTVKAALKTVLYAKINEAGEAELYTSAAAAAIAPSYAINTFSSSGFASTLVDAGSIYVAHGDIKAYISNESAFVYYANAGQTTFKTALLKGTHAANAYDSTAHITVYKTDAVTGISTLVASFIDHAYESATTPATELYFVAKYNGYTAEGYGYTIYKIGSTTPETIYVSTQSGVPTAGGVQLAKIQTTTAANGKVTKQLVDAGSAATLELKSITLGQAPYTVGNVTYMKDSGSTVVKIAANATFVNNYTNGKSTAISELVGGDVVYYYYDEASTSATKDSATALFVYSENAVRG